MADEAKIKGPASYFPSIEKTYGKPIAHWIAVLDGLRDKKHMEQVATSSLNMAWAMGMRTPWWPTTGRNPAPSFEKAPGLQMKIALCLRLVEQLLDPDMAGAVRHAPVDGVAFLVAENGRAYIGANR